MTCEFVARVNEICAPDHPDTATRLANLALTYGYLGRYADALPLGERAPGSALRTPARHGRRLADHLAQIGHAYLAADNCFTQQPLTRDWLAHVAGQQRAS